MNIGIMHYCTSLHVLDYCTSWIALYMIYIVVQDCPVHDLHAVFELWVFTCESNMVLETFLYTIATGNLHTASIEVDKMVTLPQ